MHRPTQTDISTWPILQDLDRSMYHPFLRYWSIWDIQPGEQQSSLQGATVIDVCTLLAALEQKLEAAASEAEALDKEASRKLPGAGKLKSAIAERERKMAALQTRIHEIEDAIFAAFSQKASSLWPVVSCGTHHTGPCA